MAVLQCVARDGLKSGQALGHSVHVRAGTHTDPGEAGVQGPEVLRGVSQNGTQLSGSVSPQLGIRCCWGGGEGEGGGGL